MLCYIRPTDKKAIQVSQTDCLMANSNENPYVECHNENILARSENVYIITFWPAHMAETALGEDSGVQAQVWIS